MTKDTRFAALWIDFLSLFYKYRITKHHISNEVQSSSLKTSANKENKKEEMRVSTPLLYKHKTAKSHQFPENVSLSHKSNNFTTLQVQQAVIWRKCHSAVSSHGLKAGTPSASTSAGTPSQHLKARATTDTWEKIEEMYKRPEAN